MPHFEKMSYDNSELLKNYLHAYQVTRDPFFREIAAGIVGWVNRVLSDPQSGGFYASQDADISLDDDGDYFTWTLEEVRAVLPEADARVIELYYDVGPQGEMHHNPAKNVLWIAREPDDIARQLGLSRRRLCSETIARRPRAVARPRATSVPLPISTPRSIPVGTPCLSPPTWPRRKFWTSPTAAPSRCAPSIASSPKPGTIGADFRIACGGQRLDGSLDDQVFMAAALLDAFECTLDRRYFDAAERATKVFLQKFGDLAEGGFFDRGSDARAHGRPRRAPQAAAGFADARRERGGGDCARPPVRLHRQSRLSRASRRYTCGICRTRGGIWPVRRRRMDSLRRCTRVIRYRLWSPAQPATKLPRKWNAPRACTTALAWLCSASPRMRFLRHPHLLQRP